MASSTPDAERVAFRAVLCVGASSWVLPHMPTLFELAALTIRANAAFVQGSGGSHGIDELREGQPLRLEAILGVRSSARLRGATRWC